MFTHLVGTYTYELIARALNWFIFMSPDWVVLENWNYDFWNYEIEIMIGDW